MPTFGKLDAYEESEDWIQYVERLTCYFSANEIDDDDKKRDILLSVCGRKTYKLMRDLLAPDKPNTKTFDELTELIKEHKHPEPSESIQRFKFNSRTRHSDESVRSYVAELRSLAEHCKYGDTLNAMLRDRLVVGINNDRIQRRLLAEPQLDFAKALDIATAMETAAKNAQDIQASGSGPVKVINKISRHQPKGQQFQGYSGKRDECYRCGGNHKAHECRFREAKCHHCKKKGHIAKKCRSKQVSDTKHSVKTGAFQKKTNYVEATSSGEEELYSIYSVGSERTDPYKVSVSVNGKEIEMDIDTGASVTVLNEDTYDSIKQGAGLTKVKGQLRTYLGQPLPVLGKTEVSVQFQDEDPVKLPVTVVAHRGPNLLGRDWLAKIKLDWKQIFSVSKDHTLEEILEENKEVFNDELGCISSVKAKIYVDENATPKYYKARPLAYSLKDKVEKELERLEKEGQIEPVEFSEWAAPIVPVVKESGEIRICGDYKVTVNAVSKLDNYPIPKTEDLYAALAGGKEFTKLDLNQAYQQIQLDEDSKRYVTINTHKGLFTYNRLPYGVSSSPGIFQRTLENVVQGIPNVLVRVDDVLITGRTRAEHLKTLSIVLERFKKVGIRLKKRKCTFLAQEVVYLGFKINKDGIKPVESKVEAIDKAPRPTNVSELKAYLGMLTYYNRFLPNLSTLLHPLYSLLQSKVKWSWGKEQEKSFVESKKLLKSASVLVHYDPSKELIVACDASAHGVAAVLSHRMSDGSDRPIAFASRTLTSAEKNYSVLERESLAIIFAVRKFHQYLYGNFVTIVTDHKPLVGLFREDKAIPTMAASRIQRWALTLSTYRYKIVYREGRDNNADALSRLPIAERTEVETKTPGDTILTLQHFESNTPVTANQIQKWTNKDKVLSEVLRCVLHGWPSECCREELKPYFNRQHEISSHDGILLWGGRVIIPEAAREVMLTELHEGHPGITRMKRLARSYLWWPGLESELEKTVQHCFSCQENRHAPANAPLHPWEFPSRPWSRLHVDFAGPFMGHTFLIIIDAYSKWLDVHIMSSMSTEATISKLRSTFAVHGLPDMIVSDNGGTFVSAEFANYMQANGIKHRTTAPWHPSSNGCAERAVQVFKEGIKKIKDGTVEEKLQKFLFHYRITPQSTTLIPPCQLLMKRQLKSRLDLIFPDTRVSDRVQEKQAEQKLYHDKSSKERIFTEGDNVLIRNFTPNATIKWIRGKVIMKTGPLSYKIELMDGKIARRHIDHIRKCYENNDPSEPDYEPEIEIPIKSDNVLKSTPAETQSSPTVTLPIRQHPIRIRKEPSYLKDYVRK